MPPALQSVNLGSDFVGPLSLTLCTAFHAKMGTIKDKNSMDLTEAENINKRWQEYKDLYRKDQHDPDNHLESDILKCE